jgi:SAM-dependent methyltransferase
MTSADRFDESYFERGVELGISCYQNYRWMPERSFVEAHAYITYMGITRDHSILDYGCAKGYFVKALRLLGYNAEGVDISRYAIDNCDPAVRGFVHLTTCRRFTHGFCKDVLEHCEDESTLVDTLRQMRELAREWLIVMPVSLNGKYAIPDYEQDITHCLRYGRSKWMSALRASGMIVKMITHRVVGIKDHWSAWPDGNLFVSAYGG